MDFCKTPYAVNNNGYLEVIIGPMFSGKTSRLIDIYKKYSICNIPVLVVNYSEDTRYNSSSVMTTHDNKTLDCAHCLKLSDMLETKPEVFQNRDESSAILINEGQFFPDLYEMVNEFVHMYRKHVYVCGLDGDYKRQKFGQILDLVPLCDSIYKITALCVHCRDGTAAIFSHRICNKTTEQKQIGAADTYIPVCRKCYMRENS